MVKKQNSGLLFLGAIGVVFGDIGTSPLYALPAIFGVSKFNLDVTNVIGVISLVLWSVTLVVTVKYIGLMMRADNKGEGGITALIAQIGRSSVSHQKKIILTLVALVGISLFYGDSVITPAISVLSAVEGTKLVLPEFTSFVVPLTIVILVGLFSLQSRGTGKIGMLFGPIMILWFVVSAIAGLGQILAYPEILRALLPYEAINFFWSHPSQGFIAMGAVILAITGAEALYADMGHFGKKSIRLSWLLLVFPALMLNYLGQGALVIHNPISIVSSYYLMFPDWMHIPAIILATTATLIASQAVISGAFSLTRQAVHLGFAPRLHVLHTSAQEYGQVYIPALNFLMALAVILIVLIFGSAAQLANAYGMAVSAALAIDTLFLLVIMSTIWRQPAIIVILTGIIFVGIDLLFVSSSSAKLIYGAWLPISIAVVVFTLLTTWKKGHQIILKEREKAEGTLLSFVNKLRHSKISRTPGFAVYLGHNPGNAPLSLHETVEQLHELHERVVIVTVITSDKPHIPEDSRIIFDGLGHPDDGISHVTLIFGYKDTPNVSRTLLVARHRGSEIDFDPYQATYFTSTSQPLIVKNHRMANWRKKLYVIMDRNANNPSEYFKLPLERTIEMRTALEL